MQTKNFIQFVDVEIFQNKSSILKDINFTIRKGDFVYILGNTGTGKSSLIQALTGHLPITKGTAFIEDISLQKVKPAQLPFLRRKLGIVSNSFPLEKNLTVKDNLEFVLNATDWTNKDNKTARIHQVLDLLKINSLVNKKVFQLTKKECLQVSIARALLNSPSILLLDAPVQDLDVQAAQEILSFLYQYAQKNDSTVFFATVNNKIPQFLAGDKILLCKDQTISEIE